MKLVVTRGALAPIAAALNRCADALEKLVARQSGTRGGLSFSSRYTDPKAESYISYAEDFAGRDDAQATEEADRQLGARD